MASASLVQQRAQRCKCFRNHLSLRINAVNDFVRCASVSFHDGVWVDGLQVKHCRIDGVGFGLGFARRENKIRRTSSGMWAGLVFLEALGKASQSSAKQQGRISIADDTVTLGLQPTDRTTSLCKSRLSGVIHLAFMAR